MPATRRFREEDLRVTFVDCGMTPRCASYLSVAQSHRRRLVILCMDAPVSNVLWFNPKEASESGCVSTDRSRQCCRGEPDRPGRPILPVLIARVIQ